MRFVHKIDEKWLLLLEMIVMMFELMPYSRCFIYPIWSETVTCLFILYSFHFSYYYHDTTDHHIGNCSRTCHIPKSIGLLSVNAAISRHDSTPDAPKRASTKIVNPKQVPFPQIDTVGVTPWARRLSSLVTIRRLRLADG